MQEEELKKPIKISQVSEQIQKNKEAKELQTDMTHYFKERDITNRGGDGKIEDTFKMSEAEAEVKQMLYDASMEDHPLPEGTTPMFNTIFTTARRNKIRTESGLLLTNSMSGAGEIDYQEKQIVLAHGPQVQQAFTGSEVVIDFESFRRRLDDSMAHKVNKDSEIVVPTIIIEDHEYLMLSERDLKYISKSVPNPNKEDEN